MESVGQQRPQQQEHMGQDIPLTRDMLPDQVYRDEPARLHSKSSLKHLQIEYGCHERQAAHHQHTIGKEIRRELWLRNKTRFPKRKKPFRCLGGGTLQRGGKRTSGESHIRSSRHMYGVLDLDGLLGRQRNWEPPWLSLKITTALCIIVYVRAGMLLLAIFLARLYRYHSITSQ